ncbi:MAG: lytic transglycosylase domain-containing protein [Sulfuricurvum sp.]
MKIIAFLLYTFSLFAGTYDVFFEKAGADFGIEASLLKRIATIESSLNPHAINQNKNGTVDIGLMQINSMHLKRLAKVGVTRQSLLDPEVNVYVAALLLSSHIRKRGYNLEAIGCYHSANPVFKNQWLRRLAMASVSKTSLTMPQADRSSSICNDPRSRFVQQQLLIKTDQKIAMGLNPKQALREAKRDVDRLMGYGS